MTLLNLSHANPSCASNASKLVTEGRSMASISSDPEVVSQKLELLHQLLGARSFGKSYEELRNHGSRA